MTSQVINGNDSEIPSGWNGRAVDYAREASIPELFAKVAQSASEKIAVSKGDRSLTYLEVENLANGLASKLVEQGVEPGDCVGVAMDGELELVVALIGVLKVGAIYVPLDSAFPPERLDFIRNDTGFTTMIGTICGWNPIGVSSSFDIKADGKADSVEPIQSDSTTSAYVMYTSGSTGEPKGVEVTHRAIARLVLNADYVDLNSDTVILQYAPTAFDASTFEIWGALLNGGKLVMMPTEDKSLRGLGSAIGEFEVNTLWLTAGLFHAMIDERISDLAPLTQLLAGGDVLSPQRVAKLLEAMPELRLINGYGPTENTTFTTCHQIVPSDVKDGAALPIGVPINNTTVFLLDTSLQPVGVGEEGELYTGGDGLANGYWGKPDLTKECFIIAPWDEGVRLYRTGDLARFRKDGAIEFLGRSDQQVKIRGFRIELGEIEEAILSEDGVSECAVVANDQGDEKQLVAYLVGTELDTPRLKTALSKRLPSYMVPSRCIEVEKIPLNTNGKVDRRELSGLEERVQDVSVEPTEAALQREFESVLGEKSVSLDTNFFDLGASSLQIARVHERIQSTLQREFPITDFFQYTTVTSLAKALDKDRASVTTSERWQQNGGDDAIAVVGLSGRFPGAPNVDAFWDLLVEGREGISHFSEEELEYENAKSPNADPSAKYVRSRSILDGVEYFDAKHFGVYPKEAEQMDPQHRILLECAQEALESAGHDPDRFGGKIGVFCGSSQNSYLLNNLARDRQYIQDFAAGYPVTNFTAMMGNDKDFLPTRIAYKLNLKGPAVAVQCACSTSLASIVEGAKSLRSGECDMVLAGGISVTLPQKRDYLYTPDGMASSDGHCRSFDADASGTVFGNGAGLVVLRRLSDALADGDQVLAVIRGFAMNNDGGDKVGYAAPSINGQVDVIREAHANAGVSADDISYIEAHGTGTPLGDPIEIAALKQAFSSSTTREGFCAVGTGKTNVGHLDIAAGVTGFIKTVLSLHKRQLPALLHFEKPNPKISFEGSPFYPASELNAWEVPEGRSRIAGVSAFGVGGTNVHVVLEEAPESNVEKDSTEGLQLLPFSATSDDALEQVSSAVLGSLNQGSLADVAFTLQEGRRTYSSRRVYLGKTASELSESKPVASDLAAASCPKVAFLLPGQGAQKLGMGRELYEKEPVFRDALDECFKILQGHLGLDLKDALFAEVSPEAEAALEDTTLAQPAIFSVEYAMAKLWQSWGIEPDLLCGHSVGEFVAATLSGVFSLEDGLRLIAARARLMGSMEGGCMLSVRASEEEAASLLAESGVKLDIAVINAASLCVIAGTEEDTLAFESFLKEKEVVAKRLHTSHAFHSRMMDEAVVPFREIVAEVSLSAPIFPILSTVTGELLSDFEALDPDYWASHLRKMVRFADAAEELRSRENFVLIEVGPGRTLATLCQMAKGEKGQLIVATSPHGESSEGAHEAALAALAKIWCRGGDVNWSVFHHGDRRRRVSLPTYQFQRERHWIERPELQTSNPSVSTTTMSTTPTPLPVPATVSAPSSGVGRIDQLVERAAETIGAVAGIEVSEMDPERTFVELGFDSLLLTQVTKEIKDEFGVEITLGQLLDEVSSVRAIAEVLHEHMPEEIAATVVPSQVVAPSGDVVTGLIQQQLQTLEVMKQQLIVATGQGVAPSAAPKVPTAVKKVDTAPKSKGIGSGISTEKADDLTSHQRAHIDTLIADFNKRTAQSKDHTQEYRSYHADPRTASGFNRMWKEMCYPIVVERSKGSRLWDLDGNEYIDLLNGFGPGFLGHQPDFIVDAIKDQIDLGFEVGPQTPLAGKTAKLLCELTGNERASFVNTGSEAVQAALRLSRTVTGRDKVVMFERDYHGNFDEVLVRAANRNGNLKTFPLAPGIPKRAVEDVIVLPYGTEESLEIVRELAPQLAAVVIEPVQSRRPEFQPREFIHEVRAITNESGTVFVFDEVVNGFRTGPRGAQGFFGVDADLVTYGKVVGAGMPIGVVAGKAKFMDTFDGGSWEYGDESYPNAPVTFFAGTFVRHPLTIAATYAMLTHLKEQGQGLWDTLNARTERLVSEVDGFFKEHEVPAQMTSFCSQMFVKTAPEDRFANLLFYHLRNKGVFILETFPSYMTTAHSDEDVDHVISVFKESVAEMQAGGFFKKTDAVSLLGVSGIAAAEEAELESKQIPTTESQREIFLASAINENASCAFNESVSFRLKGKLDIEALIRSYQAVVARHDVLNGRFSKDAETLIISEATAEVERLKASEAELEEIIASDASEPFDLESGPVIRAKIVELGSDNHVFMVSAHHIVCDGWSFNVIAEELSDLYAVGGEVDAAELQVSKPFSQYAKELSRILKDAHHRESEAFWIDQYETIPAPIQLPLDRSYPSQKTYAGGTVRRRIGIEKYTAIKALGAKHNCTLYNTLSAAFEVFVHRLSGQDDIVVGIPASGQSLSEGNDYLVGHCVNFLPVRSQLSGNPSFVEFLKARKQALVEMTDYRDFTYGELLQKLSLPRDPYRMPLLEVAFNVERMDYFKPLRDLESTFEPNPKTHVHYTIFLNVVESKDGLMLDLDYNADVLDRETAESWLGRFEEIIDDLIHSPEKAVVEKLAIPSMAVRRDFPSVNERFAEIAAIHADKVAIRGSGGELITYGELDQWSRVTASELLEAGVSRGDLVGVGLARSPRLIATLLGVLRAGAAYLPMDPEYPEERIATMLDDASPKALVIDSDFGGKASGVPVVNISELAEAKKKKIIHVFQEALTAEDLAYVIYTSGSTGTPKGSLIPHRGITRLVVETDYCDLGEDQTFLLAASLSFDASTFEIWGPLLNGGTLGLLSPGRCSLIDIEKAIQAHKVTTLWLTAGLFQLVMEERPSLLTGVKQLLTGGDILPPIQVRDAKRAYPSLRLINGYGPTENTTFTVCHTVTESDLSGGAIPIGRPISGTSVHIFDKDGGEVGVGIEGELFAGGAGVGLGYLDRPELTAERFVSNSRGQLMYRTGDRVRMRADGVIEFLGRIDNQVKIRGFRIEIGEIERVLTEHSSVSQCAAIAEGESAAEKALSAFLVCEKGATSGEIRTYLEKKLPPYMVPTKIILIDALPLTPNGKVDHAKLLQVGSAEVQTSEPGDTKISGEMREIWEELLNNRDIGLDEPFFEIGGHSMLGLRLMSRVEERFGVNLPLATLFEAPTVRALSNRVLNRGDKLLVDKGRGSAAIVSSKTHDHIVTLREGDSSQAPLVLVHGGLGDALFYRNLLPTLSEDITLVTIESPLLRAASPLDGPDSVEGYGSLYCQQLRDQFGDLEFRLGGYSFGGVIAYEMAMRMERDGIDPEFLGLFDTCNPQAPMRRRSSAERLKHFLKYRTKDSRAGIGELVRHGIGAPGRRQQRIAARERTSSGIWSEDDDGRTIQLIEVGREQLEAYEPGQYGGKLTLFRATVPDPVMVLADDLGWSERVTGGVEIVPIEGEHELLFKKGTVEALGSLLSKELSKLRLSEISG